MGIIDYFAKKRGYVKPQKRAFSSAQISRLTSSWTTMPKPADVDIKAGLRTLRARSREQAQNNDHVRQFLRLIKTNVVGHQGVILQARSIGRKGQLDTPANDAIEGAWKEWGRDPEVTGQNTWKGLQRLIVENVARDGEVLIRKVRSWKHNRFGYALQVMDPEVVDVEHNRDLKNGHTIQMGVELDGWRRPVAYHLNTPKATADSYEYFGKKYTRVPASEIIHLFLPEWVWQTRGVPFLATALLRLNMLGGYEEAELVASRGSAAKMGFYTQDPELVTDYTADGQDATGNLVQDAEAGTMELLPPGVGYVAHDPQHPSTAYKDFVKAMLRGLASGMGVSYHSLSGDLEGANYSSLREGKLLDRDVWMMLQDWFIDAFCSPIYQDWLEEQYLRGTIQINGMQLSGPLTKYQKVTWQGRRWPWVDPKKEMDANKESHALRTRSISDIIREQGRDPEDVWLEIARDYERLRDLGIEPTEPAKAGFLMPGENEDENENSQD